MWANLGPVFLDLVRTPPQERDAGLIEASCQKAEGAFAELDDHLNGRAYVDGPSPNAGTYRSKRQPTVGSGSRFDAPACPTSRSGTSGCATDRLTEET